MRIGEHTAGYTDPTGNHYQHHKDVEPAVLEAIPDPEHNVGREAGLCARPRLIPPSATRERVASHSGSRNG